jgi:hypothetical protein
MWTFFKMATNAIACFVWRLGPRLLSLAFVICLAFLLVFAVLDTRRDVAYRNSTPDDPKCATWGLSGNAVDSSKDNSTILTKSNYNNDEQSAVTDDPALAPVFTCMLQRHAMREGFVPYSKDKAGNPSIGYYLSFLEFQENGVPAEPTQFRALAAHLKKLKEAGRQNFVFAFVHGWRHDARVGDANVENVRLMSAHLASFLQQRCEVAGRYCGVSVTAVYVGWRGARVDEQRLNWLFRGYFPGLTSTIGDVLASMTLFDRKPVSERIAPSVVSALQEIDRRMREGENDSLDWFDRSRMIVAGHSLGGNLLATALQDQMIAIVNKNFDAIQKAAAAPNTIQPKPLVKSPLGDLVVLLNPAAEAEKWTSIQRTFSNRVNAAVASKDVQTAYRMDQRPIYLSLTASHSWPANDIHSSDIDGIAQKFPAVKDQCDLVRHLYDEYEPSYDYDSATYDLFPLFKLDFRPPAQTIEDWSDPNRFDCTPAKGDPKPDWVEKPGWIKKEIWIGLAAALRNLPFMDTNIEQTRTIGHVDPMRAPYSLLTDSDDPATWIGTTHEFLINAMGRKQKPPRARWLRITEPKEKTPNAETASYQDAASAVTSECDIVDGWLITARREKMENQRQKASWDSGWSNRTKAGKIVPGKQPNLTHIRFLPDDPKLYVEGQFRQVLHASGMRPITGPNDPFWNIRAFESAMTSHDGYVSYPLICSIFQFAMDKITDDAVASPSKP